MRKAPRCARRGRRAFGYPVPAPMDRQTTFLLALALLVVAAAVVSATGWTLLVRDRRSHRAALAADAPATGADEHHLEAAEER